MSKKTLIIILPMLAAFVIAAYYAVIFIGMYLFYRAESKPRYEVGQYKGARFCADCHQEIYDQWFENSSHAEANNNPRFFSFKDKVTGNFVTNFIIGDANCHACMGPREVPEGVNCEICHGLVIPTASIEETHEKKFKPGLKDVKKPAFCATCHQFPESGEGMSV
ncbi:MAG: hypothetical protein GTO24_15985 [candidate division Zixibacteria bacterium]|nr:hypothetical protein [candidate division Zixibacteria bacterium]